MRGRQSFPSSKASLGGVNAEYADNTMRTPFSIASYPYTIDHSSWSALIRTSNECVEMLSSILNSSPSLSGGRPSPKAYEVPSTTVSPRRRHLSTNLFSSARPTSQPSYRQSGQLNLSLSSRPTAEPETKELIHHPTASPHTINSLGSSGPPNRPTSNASFQNPDSDLVGGGDTGDTQNESISPVVAVCIILAAVLFLSASILLAIRRNRNNGEPEVDHFFIKNIDDNDIEAGEEEMAEIQGNDSRAKISETYKGFDGDELFQQDGRLTPIEEIIQESSSLCSSSSKSIANKSGQGSKATLGSDIVIGEESGETGTIRSVRDFLEGSAYEQENAAEKSCTGSQSSFSDDCMSSVPSYFSSRYSGLSLDDTRESFVSSKVDVDYGTPVLEEQHRLSQFNTMITKGDWAGVVAAAEKYKSFDSDAEAECGISALDKNMIKRGDWKGVVLGSSLQIRDDGTPPTRTLVSGESQRKSPREA